MQLYIHVCLLLTLILIELRGVSGWCLNRQTAEAATIVNIEYSQDRSMFVTVSGGNATLWNAVNFLILTRISLSSGTVTDVKISKNNTIWGVAASTATVYLYSTSPPYTLLQTIATGIGGTTTKIDFSYDGTLLLACVGTGSTAKVFSLVGGANNTATNNGMVNCRFAPSN